LAALYATAVATGMFIMPVIYHARHYPRLDVERFLSRTKKPVTIGILFITLAMSLGLGLALNSRVPAQIAYSLALFSFLLYFLSILQTYACLNR